MKLEIDIPDYSLEQGLRTEWDYGFTISVQVVNGIIMLKADGAGLTSLARHLLTLAQTQIPSAYHLHYDDQNSLEPGSSEMIIEKL